MLPTELLVRLPYRSPLRTRPSWILRTSLAQRGPLLSSVKATHSARRARRGPSLVAVVPIMPAHVAPQLTADHRRPPADPSGDRSHAQPTCAQAGDPPLLQKKSRYRLVRSASARRTRWIPPSRSATIPVLRVTTTIRLAAIVPAPQTRRASRSCSALGVSLRRKLSDDPPPVLASARFPIREPAAT
jgi:hypothetical protein